MKAGSMEEGMGRTIASLDSPSDRRMANGYGTAQQKVDKQPGPARSMDEAHKCTILESDSKIANGDISEHEGASVAKSFGERTDRRSSTLDLHKSTERTKSRCWHPAQASPIILTRHSG
jgi:hypothetical protein